MISKRITGRKDGKSSASTALRYGEGLTPDRKTGELQDKSHRTRLGNFGLVDDGVYAGLSADDMADLIEMASIEMQSNCDFNTRVGPDKKLAHFVISFNQYKPIETVLRDTEDSMLASMKLDKNHFATFLHDDNGYWHLHIFASRIEKEKPHKGNPLWHDQINRDKVCREVEIRHRLQRDNGLHEVNKNGEIVEIPRAERQAKRESKRESKLGDISDKAKTTEIYSGEKSFQTWCNEMRIGDRLKHAKSWQDIHASAAAYNCEIKPKGAGFVICPAGEKGGIQLSKVGLKNLPAKFGAFHPTHPSREAQSETAYKPAPIQAKAESHYVKWRAARDAFKPVKTDRINEQREAHKLVRKEIRAQQKTELAKIRASKKGPDALAAISIAKMQHTVALAALIDRFAQDRQALHMQFAEQGPGNTFRDYLVIEAGKGDNIALGLARKYGVEESTDVLRKREADQLKIVAAASGQEYRPAPRLNFTHQVERNGTVVFDLGHGRKLTDSAISKQVQLNDAAARSPEAIATALRFATTKFGNTLTLTGSPSFQRLAVETAARNGLNINFKDPVLQAYKQEFAASIYKERNYFAPTQQALGRRIVPDLSHLTPRQVAKGVEDVLTRSLDQGIPPEHIIRAQQHIARPATERSGSLHELPVSGVDAERQNAGMLLPYALHGRLGDIQAGQDQDLRRPGASETRRRNEGDAATGDSGVGDITIRTANDAIIRTTGTGKRVGEASKRRGLPVVASPMLEQQARRAATPAAETPSSQEIRPLTEKDQALAARINAAIKADDVPAMRQCMNEIGTPKRQAAEAVKAGRSAPERALRIERHEALSELSKQLVQALAPHEKSKGTER